jgi:hypothetical protein
VKKPRLREVHRLLVIVFAVFSAGFGLWALFRWGSTGETAAAACGGGFLVVAAGCGLYLRTSRYLKT